MRVETIVLSMATVVTFEESHEVTRASVTCAIKVSKRSVNDMYVELRPHPR